MKNKILILFSATVLLCTLPVSAQSLQTLLDNHAEVMGGIEKWKLDFLRWPCPKGMPFRHVLRDLR